MKRLQSHGAVTRDAARSIAVADGATEIPRGGPSGTLKDRVRRTRHRSARNSLRQRSRPTTRQRVVSAAIVAATVSVLSVGCATNQAETEQRSVSIGIIVAGEVSFAPEGGVINELVYDSLVTVRDVGEFDPSAATEWEFNDDFTALTLTLRDDVEFPGGTVVDADLVKVNVEAYSKLPGAGWMIGADVIDEHTVRINVDGTQPPDNVLVNLAAMPLVGAAGMDDDELATAPLGSGPYRFVPERSSLGQEVVLVANENYWNPEAVYWDEIVVRQFSDGVAVTNALKSGQIDVGPADSGNAGELEASGLELSEAPAGYAGLYFVDRDGVMVPALGDVRVRQAINMAFDRDAIVEIVENGYGTPANQPWGISWPAYRDDLTDRYAYDPEAARALLAEAGYPDGFDLELPSFGLKYEPAVAQALEDIGIRVTYTSYPAADYLTLAGQGTWPVLLNSATYGPTMFAAVDPYYIPADGFYNVLADVDPVVKDLHRRALFGTGNDKAEAAAELGEYILDEAWFAVFSFPSAIWAHSPNVSAVPDPILPAQKPQWRTVRPAE